MNTTLRGGIDIGSNSVTACLVDAQGEPQWSRVQVTGLGRALASTGRLADDDIARTLDAVSANLVTMSERGVAPAQVLTAITAPGRVAANADMLLSLLRTTCGVEARVLSGEEEADYGFHGAVGGLDLAAGDVLVIDIGGASTELSFGAANSGPRQRWSLPVGAARLRYSTLLHDPPRPDELTNAIGEAHDHLDDALRAHPEFLGADVVVGAAGTIVTTAAVELGLATWDEAAVHGFRLTRHAAEDVFRTLATESLADRCHNPGLPAERADIIVGGLCVLVAVMRRADLDDLVVSTRGVADGLALSIR